MYTHLAKMYVYLFLNAINSSRCIIENPQQQILNNRCGNKHSMNIFMWSSKVLEDST